MKADVTDDKKNPLMKRRELTIKVSHEGASTPSRKEILSLAEKSAKCDSKLTVVRRIESMPGKGFSLARIDCYEKQIPEFIARNMRTVKEEPAPEAEAPAEAQPEAEAKE